MAESKATEIQGSVRFGLIGTNFITDRLLDAGKHVPNFTVTALYSRTQARAEEYVAQHGLSEVTLYTDLQALANSTVVDAIYIASPTSFHCEQALIMIGGGKHVLCEKPVCSNRSELDRVLMLAKEKKVAFMEAMRTIHTPNFQMVKESLDKIAPIRHFNGTFCQLSSRYPAYLAGETPNAFNPTFSNGVLMDLGCYAVYSVVALLGKPTGVRYLPVMMRTGVDGSGTVVLAYGDKNATLNISKQAHSFSQTEIMGENGTIRIDNLSEFSAVSFRKKGEEEKAWTVPQHTNNMVYELDAFVKLVQGCKEGGLLQDTNLSWELATNVMDVLDAARKDGNIVFPADSQV